MTKNALILLLALSACRAHQPYSQVMATAGKGDCEGAAERLVKAGEPEKPVQTTAEKVGGTTASYAATAVGFTSDILISYSSGIVVSVAACSPLVLIDGLLHSKGDNSLTGQCVKEIGPTVIDTMDPGMSNMVYHETAHWRGDVDYTPLSEAMRTVAECYMRRGGEKYLKLAYAQLDQIVQGPIYAGSKNHEKKLVDEDYGKVRGLLSIAPAPVPEASPAPEDSEEHHEAKKPRVVEGPVGRLAWRYVGVPVKAQHASEICANSRLPDGTKMHIASVDEARRALSEGLNDPRFAEDLRRISPAGKAWVRQGGLTLLFSFKVQDLIEPAPNEQATGSLCILDF